MKNTSFSILLISLFLFSCGSKQEKKNGKKGNVKVSQPISGQQQQMIHPMVDGTAISSLPTYDTSSSSAQTQQLPNYDSMY